MVIFEVPGKPQGKARARTFYNPRIGRSQSITPQNTVLYENLIKQCYLAAENSDKSRWFNSEPLEIFIDVYYEIPKSTTKKVRAEIEKGKLYPTKKPDADNIAKVICDALNKIAYKDDSQIVNLSVRKLYSADRPKVMVKIFKKEIL